MYVSLEKDESEHEEIRKRADYGKERDVNFFFFWVQRET